MWERRRRRQERTKAPMTQMVDIEVFSEAAAACAALARSAGLGHNPRMPLSRNYFLDTYCAICLGFAPIWAP
jgi:hypothetical protein